MEVVREGHLELLKLRAEALIEFVLALFREVHGRSVTEVVEVSSRDKAVAAVVPRTAGYEDIWSFGWWREGIHCLGYGLLTS